MFQPVCMNLDGYKDAIVMGNQGCELCASHYCLTCFYCYKRVGSQIFKSDDHTVCTLKQVSLADYSPCSFTWALRDPTIVSQFHF